MRRRHIFIIFIALILSLLAYSSSMVLFKMPAAQASTYVIGSDPVDGSTIADAPEAVHIYFNAAISTLTKAHVFVAQQNALVEIGANTGVVSGANRAELIIPLQQPQKLPQGSYLVRWTAVAYADGRTTLGTIGFNVVVSSAGLSGTSILGPGTSNDLSDTRTLDIDHFTNLLVVVWELILLASLMLLIGILVMEQFVLSDRGRGTELRTHTHKRVHSLQWLCLSALLFSEFVLFFLRTTDIVEITQPAHSYLTALQGLLLNTDYGRFWLVSIVLILIAMSLLYRTNRTQQPYVEPESIPPMLHTSSSGLSSVTASQAEEEATRGTVQTLRPAITRNMAETPTPAIVTAEKRHLVAWFLLIGLLLLTLVLSRASAQTFQPHLSAIILDWLNLAALGIWSGSFAYLSYLILPLFNNKELDHLTETLTTVLQRLIPFILTAIGIEVVSTLFLSEAAISEPQQFLNDPYGRTLLIQLVLFVVMIGLSLYTMLYLHPTFRRKILLLPFLRANLPVHELRESELQQTRKGLHFTSTVITWLGGGILLCMALMTFFTPPIHFPDMTYNNQPAASTSTQTQQIGDLSVSLQLLPGHSNTANTVVLLINDNKGKPVTDAQVRLTTNMQTMDMGTGHAVINGGNPVYTTTFAKNAAFDMAGVWVITVAIQEPGQNAVQGMFQVTIPTSS